jgi:hypothetical protein
MFDHLLVLLTFINILNYLLYFVRSRKKLYKRLWSITGRKLVMFLIGEFREVCNKYLPMGTLNVMMIFKIISAI